VRTPMNVFAVLVTLGILALTVVEHEWLGVVGLVFVWVSVFVYTQRRSA
jgi:hypothetical protein